MEPTAVRTEKRRVGEMITDYEVRSLEHNDKDVIEKDKPWWYQLVYVAVGMVFGVVFVKAELTSWLRMQEMFRFQSFHMFGVMGTAMVVAIISVWLIKTFRLKTLHGEDIHFTSKKFNKGQVIGGLLFGFGWAMTGACPGPLFAQIGSGATVVIVVLLSAIAGTWVYGYFRDKLPH